MLIMCQPASFIVTATKVLWHPTSDSHESIIAKYKLDDNSHPNFVRVEIFPFGGDYTQPFANWVFGVDQDILPNWFDEDEAHVAVLAELPHWHAARFAGADIRRLCRREPFPTRVDPLPDAKERLTAVAKTIRRIIRMPLNDFDATAPIDNNVITRIGTQLYQRLKDNLPCPGSYGLTAYGEHNLRRLWIAACYGEPGLDGIIPLFEHGYYIKQKQRNLYELVDGLGEVHVKVRFRR